MIYNNAPQILNNVYLLNNIQTPGQQLKLQPNVSIQKDQQVDLMMFQAIQYDQTGTLTVAVANLYEELEITQNQADLLGHINNFLKNTMGFDENDLKMYLSTDGTRYYFKGTVQNVTITCTGNLQYYIGIIGTIQFNGQITYLSLGSFGLSDYLQVVCRQFRNDNPIQQNLDPNCIILLAPWNSYTYQPRTYDANFVIDQNYQQISLQVVDQFGNNYIGQYLAQFKLLQEKTHEKNQSITILSNTNKEVYFPQSMQQFSVVLENIQESFNDCVYELWEMTSGMKVLQFFYNGDGFQRPIQWAWFYLPTRFNRLKFQLNNLTNNTQGFDITPTVRILFK